MSKLINTIKRKEGVTGKVTVAFGLFGMVAVGALAILGGYSAQVGAASSATTAVKVLNTPPIFDNGNTAQVGYPGETISSATTTPWIDGGTFSWSATAHHTAGNHIYLLICSASTTPPTANSSAAPVCGTTQLAVSSSFFNAAHATSSVTVFATTTLNLPVQESLPWVAYVCDDDSGYPLCSVANPGQGGATNASPAAITHPFNFSALGAITPADPGTAINITTTAAQTHTDSQNGTVLAKLYVCKSNLFVVSTKTCTDGMYASTTVGAATNPGASFAFPVPTAANTYPGNVYMVDQYGYEAIGAIEGSSTTFTVNNVAPSSYNVSIASSTIILSNPGGFSTSTGYSVNFNADDNNGCKDKTGVNEMATATLQFYRATAGTAATACTGSSHDDHSCYNTASTTSQWFAATTCLQSACPLGGITSTWSCSFPLTYMSDPTGAGTPWAGNGWYARTSMKDSGGLSSAGTSSVSSSQLAPFVYADLSSTGINYNQFQPGFGDANVGASSSEVLGVISKGNTSIDVGIRASHMCPTYSTSTPCVTDENSSTIYANRQHFATSSIVYASANAASSTLDTNLALHVQKNVILNSYAQKSIYWGIFVPGTLTMSGDYKGQNNLTMLSNPDTSSW